MTDLLRKKKIDPSEIRQSFTNISVIVHCCRYWIFSEWELANLASPFWRIYHNTSGDARILFNGKLIKLTKNKVVIVPPNTAFSSYLKNREYIINREKISGKKIENENEILLCNSNENTDHLFIHFNLGMPYDFVEPGIYDIEKNPFLEEFLSKIKLNAIYGEDEHAFSSSLLIHLFILHSLNMLPENLWVHKNMDKRILDTLRHIKSNVNEELTNLVLAKRTKMAANSFARLFKENTGSSVQQFVVKSRIENACLLLHHSEKSIDTIASECGFCDRYHFSKTFKQITGITPFYYKKHVTLQ